MLAWRRGFDCVCVALGGAEGAERCVGCAVDFDGAVVSVGGGAALRGRDVAPFESPSAFEGAVEQSVVTNPPDAESRRPIDEPLVTGAKAVDMLLPLGEGQSVLLSGAPGSGLGAAAAVAVAQQANSGAHVVVAACGAYEGALREPAEWRRLAREAGMSDEGNANLTVVAPAPGCGAGERYACALAACSVAEGSGSEGARTMVVIDDAGALSGFWKAVARAAPPKLNVQRQEVQDGDEEGAKAVEEMNAEMVEVAGMLVSKEAAERRGIFSSLLQRAACFAGRGGGGTLSMLALACQEGGQAARASGREAALVQKQIDQVMAYETITDEQKERMVAALRAKLAVAEGVDEADAADEEAVFVSQEVAEEIKSISDGHVVLAQQPDGADTAFSVNLRQSLVRIGRVAPPWAKELASKMRLELVQTMDEVEYASGTTDDAGVEVRRARLDAATTMLQQASSPASTDAQAVLLYALTRGLCDGRTDGGFGVLDAAAAAAIAAAPGAAEELVRDGKIADEAAAQVMEEAFVAAFDS